MDRKALMKRSREMGQHPRSLFVPTATAEMSHAIAQVQDKYGLTAIESVQCLVRIIELDMKYALRYERHGNYDTGGDERPVPKRRKS
jgi:hypothetical protein